jgi:hypothetical protein
MGMQKFRADKARPVCPNGATEWVSEWMGGPTLAKVENCPCEDGKARTVYITGEPCTWFSIPACTRVRGQYVSGFVTSGEDGPRFLAYRSGKTAGRMQAAA